MTGSDRFCRNCGAPVLDGDPPTEVRKNVVVLFIDLVGSTGMAERHDPEVIRRVLDRYYRTCADCVIEHGGTLEKYIGDAIMAVFGIPTSREDDAVRAIRAAHTAVDLVRGLGADLRLPDIELDAHCGISSGQAVVVHAPGTEFRVIGDTVNTASRLQSAAGPGQVLVNGEAAHLVRHEVELAEVAPLPLRGKANPVPAWQVVSLHASTAPADRTAMVDRHQERAALAAAYRRSVAESTCHRVHVSGGAGLGKSRLVRDFTSGPEARTATVLTGRCESYGKDITYHPVVSMIETLTDGDAGLPDVLGGDDADRRALLCLTALCAGCTDGDRSPAGAAEIRWAVARLITTVARRGPVIIVWEDLQWAEPALLDLIDELVDSLRDVPVLMVCVTRILPGDGRSGDTQVRIGLEPLTPTDTMRLAVALAGTATAEVTAQSGATGLTDTARIAQASDGNPLFAVVMADAIADGRPCDSVPPTVTAVLQARFDALPATERLVLQWAAVIGREFDTDTLLVLAAAQARTPVDVPAALRGLVRRGVVQRAGTGRHQFTQTLMYETCAAMTAKTQRADWHAVLAGAGWDRGDRQEVVMHHAETACLLLREVRPDDRRLPDLLDKAVPMLAEQGSVALQRKNLTAAVALFGRALALTSPGQPGWAALIVRLCEALLTAGDSERALRLVQESGQDCPRSRDRLTLRIQRGIVLLRLGMIEFDAARAEIDAITTELVDDADDDLNWCLRHQLAGLLDHACDRTGVAEAEFGEACSRARRLGDKYVEDRLLGARCELAQWSPTPVPEALRLCDELVRRFDADRLLLVPVLTTRARLLAMTDRITEARAALATARQHATDLRATLAGLAVTQMDAVVDAMAGDHDKAITRFTEAAAGLREVGHVVPARTLEIYAIREMVRAGGQHAAGAGALLGRSDDSQLDQRARVWAGLLRARLFGGDRAVEFSRGVLAAILSQDPCLLGDAWFEHATIAHAGGRHHEVAPAIARSLGHYSAKGATLPARMVRTWAATAGVGTATEPGDQT